MNATVLVVEDNPQNMKLATLVLKREGYDVVGAIDADDALTKIRQALPDLILMDVGLPKMDGLALTRLLRATPATAAVPIIAVTAFAMRGDEHKAIDAGCDAYISKPISVTELGQKVADVLGAARRGRLRPGAAG